MRVAMRRTIKTADYETLTFEYELERGDLSADLTTNEASKRMEALVRLKMIAFELAHGVLTHDERRSLLAEQAMITASVTGKTTAVDKA